MIVTTIRGGVSSMLILGTDYTVGGIDQEDRGSIKWSGTLAIGDSLKIKRAVDITQPIQFGNFANFFAATHEDAFDHCIMIDQQQQDQINRAVLLSEDSTASNQSISILEPHRLPRRFRGY